jgi:hypothetical protein
MYYNIYVIKYGTMFNESLRAVVSADSREKSASLLEKHLNEIKISFVKASAGFEILDMKDTGFKSDKEGIIFSAF